MADAKLLDAIQDRNEIYDETFEGLDGRGIRLGSREFNGCTFEGVQLSESSLANARFLDCVFRSCDLSNAMLRGATFRDVSFEGCKILGVNWTEASVVAHPKFDDCQLNYGNFAGMDLRKIQVTRCVVREADLSRANLSEADCSGSDFGGSRFDKANLTKAYFRNARGYAINPLDVTLKKAKFSLPEALALLAPFGIDLD